jgi:hypothetical protein
MLQYSQEATAYGNVVFSSVDVCNGCGVGVCNRMVCGQKQEGSLLKRWIFNPLLVVSLTTTLLTGCGQQALTELKPTTAKQRVAVIYQSDADTQQTVHSFLLDQLHTSKHTFEDQGFSDSGNMIQVLRKTLESNRDQLLITNADEATLAAVGNLQENSDRIAWIPDPVSLYQDSTRFSLKPAVTVDRNGISFVEGFFAGLLPNIQKIAVVVPSLEGDGSKLANMVQNGIRYAGFSGTISVVDLKKLTDSLHADPLHATKPTLSKLDSQVLIVPMPVDVDLVSGLSGKSLILGYPAPSQLTHVVADVKPVFAESLEALLKAWNQQNWKPGQTLTIFPDSIIRIRYSYVTKDESIQKRVQALEQSIANGSFRPETYRPES